MAGKDKVAALVLDREGAPAGWNVVDGIAGLVHTDIPVPHLNAEEYVKAHKARQAEARKAWDKFEREQEAKGLRFHGREPFVGESCPVKLVHVTEAEAEKGTAAHNSARQQAAREARHARRSSDDTEAALAHNESAALAGGEE